MKKTTCTLTTVRYKDGSSVPFGWVWERYYKIECLKKESTSIEPKGWKFCPFCGKTLTRKTVSH
jgi:rRNA maturation endonuclease Nob1